ncbi:MAG: putative DNA binding domain-containing protein [Kiritimatiellae bacterium]|nr:putative DNA binding domain-containing protein [Kiritimatiellia bacterium]
MSDNISIDQLKERMLSKEGENLEFKAARNNYPFEKLVKYCAALANENGGEIIFGVTDNRPRSVVNSQAFEQPERTRAGLIQKLHLNIDFSTGHHPNGRVLIFQVPTHPVGSPVKYNGVYWKRQGDSLVAMSEDELRAVFAEAGHDFSADICSSATFDDLDSVAIENFRKRWIKKSGNQALATLTQEQLLNEAEAIVDGKLTYASLILFATHKALGKQLSQAEVVFEYRTSAASGSPQQRKEFRQGFFAFYDELWNTINLRNDIQHFQSGLFILDISTFSERIVRESLLNAVSHRDYQLGGNIFIRQYPRRLLVESPGGFPVGITEHNVLNRQSPGNRRIADIFAKCGLVERSGQGMNLMFELSIQESKAKPDFTGTDQYQVALNLYGEVQDSHFLQFLERIGQETLGLFNTADFLLLDYIHKQLRIPDYLRSTLHSLIEKGIVERFGRGRGVKYILSRRYYRMVNENGNYTRRKGLDRETNKALLIKHIKENKHTGSRLKELMQVLPTITMPQVQTLLRELKSVEKIYKTGRTRAALWYPQSETESITSNKNNSM